MNATGTGLTIPTPTSPALSCAPRPSRFLPTSAFSRRRLAIHGQITKHWKLKHAFSYARLHSIVVYYLLTRPVDAACHLRSSLPYSRAEPPPRDRRRVTRLSPPRTPTTPPAQAPRADRQPSGHHRRVGAQPPREDPELHEPATQSHIGAYVRLDYTFLFEYATDMYVFAQIPPPRGYPALPCRRTSTSTSTPAYTASGSARRHHLRPAAPATRVHSQNANPRTSGCIRTHHLRADASTRTAVSPSSHSNTRRGGVCCIACAAAREHGGAVAARACACTAANAGADAAGADPGRAGASTGACSSPG